jgi:hypothetical protein
MATRAQIAANDKRIEAIKKRIDPARQVLIVVDCALDELLGADSTDLVCRRHVELYPRDARATFLVVRTGSSRDSPHGQSDMASGQLLAEIRARQQKPLAITWQPGPECDSEATDLRIPETPSKSALN